MFKRTPFVLCLVLYMCAMHSVTWASTLNNTTIKVIDNQGNALANIVLEINALSPKNAATITNKSENSSFTIKQENQQFVPHISVVPVNTTITFPNKDRLQHHVYSFSPAKMFEVTLKEQFTSAPINFDKPGIVELGCNIHDWMLAYVYIADGDWSGQSNAQGEVLINLPSGEYSISLWHPRLSEQDITHQYQVIIDGDNNDVVLQIKNELFESLTGYDSVEAVDGY